jgi:hypothetical protein
MSTRLNVTSNLFGLSNALGLEKQAAQLLRNSIKHFRPGEDTLRSMQKIVTKAPRTRSGALSPTKMVSYITNNQSKLPGYAGVFGSVQPPSMRFTALAREKASLANYRARQALTRYADRISSGEVDALDPATLKRMKQLQARKSALADAVVDINNNLADLKEMNPFYRG